MFGPDLSEFKFISVGPRGEITIAVEFSKNEYSNIVTLAFGNALPGGEIYDEVRNDNKDRNIGPGQHPPRARVQEKVKQVNEILRNTISWPPELDEYFKKK